VVSGSQSCCLAVLDLLPHVLQLSQHLLLLGGTVAG
jgi:hypothetical protein